MACNFVPENQRFLIRLCEVLGIRADGIKRVVLDAACDDVVKVYVQRYLDESEGEPILEALAETDRPHVVEVQDLEVDEKGNVAGAVRSVRLPAAGCGLDYDRECEVLGRDCTQARNTPAPKPPERDGLAAAALAVKDAAADEAFTFLAGRYAPPEG